jgi:hypothetical protein
VREQDTDAYQNRFELEDAFALSARGLLFSQGDRRTRNAVNGSHLDPAIRLAIFTADGSRRDALPRGDDTRRGPTHPQSLPVRSAIDFPLYLETTKACLRKNACGNGPSADHV